MRKPTINFIVDASAFMTLVAMISTGFVMRYVLPPGSGRVIGDGLGQAAGQKSITLLWGLTRHDWGLWHFRVSLALMAILAVHLFLHWRWITSVIRNRRTEHSGARFGLGVVGLLTVIAFAAAPFLSPKQTIPRYRLVGETAETPSVKIRGVRIRGAMTLRDVEQQTGTPVAVLLEELDLPAAISPDSHLGRLSRVYGFTLDEIDEIVDRHEKYDGVE